MKILLLGIMGSGKTAVGRLLASKLNARFVELDDYALQNSGYESIEEVFQKSRSLWQELEIESCAELSSEDKNMVIACSGDIVENQINLLYFKEDSAENPVIYLKASPDILVQRLKGIDKDFHDSEDESLFLKIKNLLAKRSFLYENLSDDVIDTDKCSIANVVKEIEGKYALLI